MTVVMQLKIIFTLKWWSNHSSPTFSQAPHSILGTYVRIVIKLAKSLIFVLNVIFLFLKRSAFGTEMTAGMQTTLNARDARKCLTKRIAFKNVFPYSEICWIIKLKFGVIGFIVNDAMTVIFWKRAPNAIKRSNIKRKGR